MKPARGLPSVSAIAATVLALAVTAPAAAFDTDEMNNVATEQTIY